ncbi:MAG: class I SAM-dependent methyltransferase [Chloroflexi bacterium]|nr:class I SAM-dependent methyltransferase [Chloroflexota bacterium]
MTKFIKFVAVSTNREVFDEIAESWYRLRHWSRFTKELERMVNRWHKGRLLNVGCAHGPDFLPFKDNFELWGVDFSAKMAELAQKYATKFHLKVELTVADATSLPYIDNTFDWAIALATYHHIQGDKQRQKAFQELRRVLKPGGEAFITVWNRWQPNFWLRSKEVTMPWKSRGKILYRYYYLFSYPELRSLLTRAGFEIVTMLPEKSYRFPLKFFSRNICALVKK